MVLVVSFAYQLANYIYLLVGGRPMQASKAFWFLGTATAAIGLTYLLIFIYKKYISQWQTQYVYGVLVFAFVLLVSRMPFVYFIDDPVVLAQIESDRQRPQNTIQLAEAIKTYVPDYKQRTWLSSGSMELSAYAPLSYYIAPNVHFSHHASNYSQRMSDIEALSVANNPEEFMSIVEQGQPRQIDAMLLYHNADMDQQGAYPLWFWQDNFPNGGKDFEVHIPQALISEKYWQEVYDMNNWVIFIRK